MEKTKVKASSFDANIGEYEVKLHSYDVKFAEFEIGRWVGVIF